MLLFYDNARDEKQLNSVLPPKSCTLFVTSRQYFTLPGLVAIDLETLSPEDAIDLVQEISSKVNHKDAETLARLCGYLPLAIRAAASALLTRPDWTPAELIKRLSDNRARLGLVESSLRLSYDALDSELQKYLRQLGVFAAPFDKEAILAVWFSEIGSIFRQLPILLRSSSAETDETASKKTPEQEADDTLGALLKTSLLKYDPNTNEYYFHDLVHLFLEERLRQDENSADVLWRYAQHYLKLASQANDDYRKGEGSYLAAIARFRQVWAHINKASERLSPESNWKKPNSADQWLEKSVAYVSKVLDIALPPRDYIPFVQRSLDAARRNKHQEAENQILNYVGLAYAALGDARQAIEYYEQALAIARDIGDRKSEGGILGNVGAAYAALGEARQAIEYYEQALAIARDIGDRKTEGMFLGNVGGAYAAFGDARQALEYYQQALAIARDIGDKGAETIILGNLGFISLEGTNRNDNIQDALRLTQETGDKRAQAYMLCAEASTMRLQGELQKSLALHEQVLKLSEEIGDTYAKCQILDNMGNTFADLGNHQRAIECYLEAMSLSADEQLTANIAWNLASVYHEQQKYDLAAKYMQITVDYEQKINHPNAQADLEALNEVRAKIQNDSTAKTTGVILSEYPPQNSKN